MYQKFTLALGLLLLPVLATAQEGRPGRMEASFNLLPTELQLSENQRTQLDKIHTETQSAYEQLRESEPLDFDQIRQLHRESREQAKAVLSEEQRTYLINLREEHHQERMDRREDRWEQRLAMREAMKAYHEEKIQPERLKARRELEAQIEATDRVELAELRELLAQHPRHEFDGPPAFEERRAVHEERRAAHEEWREQHQAEIERVHELTEKYREEIDAALATLSDLQSQWRRDLREIREKFRPEQGPNPRSQRGHHRHHPPRPHAADQEDQQQIDKALDHDRNFHRARAFLMLAIETSPAEAEITISDFDQINLAPNPANDQVSVSYQLQSAGPVQLSIMDESGRLIQQLPKTHQEAGFQQTRLQLGELPAGNYRLVIESDTQRIIQSLVIGRK
ncbi:MAG: T9SS type A sorting domain-containing protein [Bacteroidota bacterium]